MSTSEFLLRGLERPRERAFLAACLVLLLGYAGTFLWLRAHADPIDRHFLRQREAFLLTRLGASPLPPGERIPPGRDGRSAPQFAWLDGWSVIEPSGGIWSDGGVARLGLALPASHRGGATLDIAATANLGATGRQAVQVAVNGRTLGEWEMRTPGVTLRLDLPAEVLPPSGALVLRFAIADPHSPASGDQRRLGIAIHGITLRPAGG